MASQSQGIQQLLVAEKRAAELVAEARKSKYSVSGDKTPTLCDTCLLSRLGPHIKNFMWRLLRTLSF